MSNLFLHFCLDIQAMILYLLWEVKAHRKLLRLNLNLWISCSVCTLKTPEIIWVISDPVTQSWCLVSTLLWGQKMLQTLAWIVCRLMQKITQWWPVDRALSQLLCGWLRPLQNKGFIKISYSRLILFPVHQILQLLQNLSQGNIRISCFCLYKHLLLKKGVPPTTMFPHLSFNFINIKQ